MKIIYLITNETFSQSLTKERVRLRRGSIMDILNTIDEGEDVKFVSNDVDITRNIGNYLKLKIEIMDIDKIIQVGSEGFIVTPSIEGVRNYDFERILPVNKTVSMQARSILQMRMSQAVN